MQVGPSSGRSFYHHSATNTSQWDPPSAAQMGEIHMGGAQQQQQVSSASPNSLSASSSPALCVRRERPPLPAGAQEEVGSAGGGGPEQEEVGSTHCEEAQLVNGPHVRTRASISAAVAYQLESVRGGSRSAAHQLAMALGLLYHDRGASGAASQAEEESVCLAARSQKSGLRNGMSRSRITGELEIAADCRCGHDARR
eukprot:2844883-Rhodomonas_salina.1